MINRSVTPINIGIGVVPASANYTVQYTYDDPSGTYLNPSVGTSVTVFSLSALANSTATADSNITFPISALRLTKNSGTGSVVMTFVQAGIAGP